MVYQFYCIGLYHSQKPRHVINIDTISKELSSLYLNGLPIKISTELCISVPEDCFIFSIQCRPWWNAALCGNSSGSSLFAKAPVYWCPEWNGLNMHAQLDSGARGLNFYLKLHLLPCFVWMNAAKTVARLCIMPSLIWVFSNQWWDKYQNLIYWFIYSKTCLKRPLKNRQLKQRPKWQMVA